MLWSSDNLALHKKGACTKAVEGHLHFRNYDLRFVVRIYDRLKVEEKHFIFSTTIVILIVILFIKICS